MNFQGLAEFRYSRDMVITYMARNSKISVSKLLQWQISEHEKLQDYFSDNMLADYLLIRKQLSNNCVWLFPTENGNLYMQDKFAQNIRRLLVIADMPDQPHHPIKLTPAQYKGLQKLRFDYQRPVFQNTIAVALLGYGALRPGEVANLKKEDFNLNLNEITLQETKGQEKQVVPLHQDLVDPLTKYLAHLKECEALFVTETGKQWCRKDVHGSTINFCKQFSKHEINPRKLRSTLAHELAAAGVPQNVISLVLRHKDPATAARYYTSVQDIGLARNAINSFNPFR